MDQLFKPSTPPESIETEGHPQVGFSIPNWAWGAAAGGAVAVTSIAVTTYHLVSRHIRGKTARENTPATVQTDLTPRGEAPPAGSSPFDPAPPGSRSPYSDGDPDETENIA